MSEKGRVVEEVFASTEAMAMTPGLLTPLPWPDWRARMRFLEVDGTWADYVEIGPYQLDVPPYRDRRDQPLRMMLTVVVSGTSTGEVDGQPLTLSAKQAALIDGRASMRFTATEPVRAFRIFVNMDHLSEEVLAGPSLPFAVLNHSPLVAACVGFISGLLQVGNPVVEPHDEVAVSQPLIALQTSLLDEALHAGHRPPPDSDLSSQSSTARRARIAAFIDEHLSERDLSVGRIADSLGVTVRTVHSTYETSATTVAADIRDRRLARAQALLVLRQEPPNVAALAARVGLNSDRLTRIFQANTGSTVREWWEQHRNPEPSSRG